MDGGWESEKSMQSVWHDDNDDINYLFSIFMESGQCISPDVDGMFFAIFNCNIFESKHGLVKCHIILSDFKRQYFLKF